MLAEKFQEFGQKYDVASGAAGLQFNEPGRVLPRAACQLMTNTNNALVEVNAPPAKPEQFHRPEPGEDFGRQGGSIQLGRCGQQASDLIPIENARVVLRPALGKLFRLKETKGICGHVAATHGER